MKDKPVLDKQGNIRFLVGSQECGLCKTKKDITQYERHIKRKGLSIMEIAFLCNSCAEKEDLIKDSIPKEMIRTKQ